METIRTIYRIGYGPSSSHTMGPRLAVEQFLNQLTGDDRGCDIRITLYGSLAATGKGHLTDAVLKDAVAPRRCMFFWEPDTVLPRHPNAMKISAVDGSGAIRKEGTVYSIGGGAIEWEGESSGTVNIYPHDSMRSILDWCYDKGIALWEYVYQFEDPKIVPHLEEVWHTMQEAIHCGIDNEGVLPGGLGVPRKAASYFAKSLNMQGSIRYLGREFSYALAVAEENAGGGIVVTAPTCGACGVLPAVLKGLQGTHEISDRKITKALAAAGLIGALVRRNASISGAEVGCQGEIGTACAMAAGAAAQLLGGSPQQIEYAAEMGMEHHLGLTCDPVAGLVQIPCIERNAMAASRAMDCATFALFSDGRHRISFDDVVDTMNRTGRDIMQSYRETSQGGLAQLYRKGS